MNINQRIKKIRQYFCSGINKEFAKELGEHPNATSNWCRDGYSVGQTVVNKIVERFGVSHIWLLTGEGEMLRSASSNTPSGAPTSSPTQEQYAELQRKYDSLNTEYMEMSRTLQEMSKASIKTNEELKEVYQQLDEAREAKRAADARISHLELLLATQKKSTERPTVGSRYGDSTSLSPTNNL